MILVENLPSMSDKDRKVNMFRCPSCMTKKRYVVSLPRKASTYRCKQCVNKFVC